MRTRVLLLVLALAATGCGDDDKSDWTKRLEPGVLRDQRNEHDRELRRPARGRRVVSAPRGGSRSRRPDLACVLERRTRSRQRKPADRRPRPHWQRAVDQRQRGTVANSVAELHSRTGNAEVFVDERGQRINGQWPGSPTPVQHDILTGSTAEGTVAAGLTCSDWTSESPDAQAQVGHSDGLGAGGSTAGTAVSWNSAHVNGSCSNTAPRGGAGRIYCFAQ